MLCTSSTNQLGFQQLQPSVAFCLLLSFLVLLWKACDPLLELTRAGEVSPLKLSVMNRRGANGGHALEALSGGQFGDKPCNSFSSS